MQQKEQMVVLVDERDNELGVMEKMEVHQKGLLHRAFSVFIFNSRNEMLLQRRATSKYHSGGLWTNTCCSHPYPGESVIDAAKRRLTEEMGFITELEFAFNFTYKASLDKGLTENEFDHVFIGKFNGDVNLNFSEAGDYCFKSMADLRRELALHPLKYTIWFRIAFPLLEKYLIKLS
jgi:isopentenyl-diphosphate delta-isomerase